MIGKRLAVDATRAGSPANGAVFKRSSIAGLFRPALSWVFRRPADPGSFTAALLQQIQPLHLVHDRRHNPGQHEYADDHDSEHPEVIV
jgi:hypothetical protein